MEIKDVSREHLEAIVKFIVFQQPERSAEFYTGFLDTVNKSIELEVSNYKDELHFKGRMK